MTDIEVRRAQPSDRPYKMFDSGGLFVLILPTGRKHWRMKYQIAGREKLLSFGSYPDVSLASARARRDEARASLRLGDDPSAIRQARKRLAAAGTHRDPARTFERVARSWHATWTPRWRERHAFDVIDSLERFVFPRIGHLDIGAITPGQCLEIVRSIEKTAKETARRVRQRMSAVFLFACAHDMTDRDPAAIIKGAMAPLPRVQPRAAVLDLDGCRELLRVVEAKPAHPVTLICMRVLALTAVRPGEARSMMWDELRDFDSAEPIWVIPGARMKMGRPHIVPLSRQAVQAIKAVRPLTAMSKFVFPNSRSDHKPMSENSLGYMLHRAGYHSRHVPHGWRSSFSTIMNERHPHDSEIIDRMLAHAKDDETEAAYNRSLHLPRRRQIAQEWADLLLEGFPPAKLLLTLPRR